MELNDLSDVGCAYTKWEEIRDDPTASAFDKGVAKSRFELYHTVRFDGEFYALHEDGVDKNGNVVCCGKCANQVDKYMAKMKRMQDNETCSLCAILFNQYGAVVLTKNCLPYYVPLNGSVRIYLVTTSDP